MNLSFSGNGRVTILPGAGSPAAVLHTDAHDGSQQVAGIIVTDHGDAPDIVHLFHDGAGVDENDPVTQVGDAGQVVVMNR